MTDAHTVELLTVPGSLDVAGRPRFRWRYLWWHAWPPAPTRQDLRDFMFTSLLASAIAFVAGALVIAALVWGRPDVLLRVWDRVDRVLAAAAVLFVVYYLLVYLDWQRKRAA